MKIPNEVTKNRKQYRFVKQINKNVFMYEEVTTGYKECFCGFDLGLIPKRRAEYKLRPELFKFL